MIIDLHVHTNRSDGLYSPKQVIKAAIKRGLDGIAITDHDVPPPRIRSDKILIIPGIEVSSDQGHVLILGTQESFRRGMPLRELIDITRENSWIIIAAHPFFIHNSVGKAVLKYKFDAIEVLNGSIVPSFLNSIAIRVANLLKAPVTAGSDAHCLDIIGSCYTMFSIHTHDVDDVLEEIRKGRTKVYGKPDFLKNIKCSIRRLPISIRRFLRNRTLRFS